MDWVKLANGNYVPSDHPDAIAATQSGAATQPAYFDEGSKTFQPGTAPAPAPPQPGGVSTPAPQTPGPVPLGPNGQPLATNPRDVQQPFYTALQRILNTDPNAVGVNDPIVKNQVNAFRHAGDRAESRQRAGLAERAAAQGFSGSGAFESQLLGLKQQRGQDESAFAADAVHGAQRARMADLMAALEVGKGIMTEGDRLMLQRELAQLDAQLRREGFGIEREQVGIQRDDLGLRRDLGFGELDLKRYLGDRSTDFNYAELGQRGSQFEQNLAAQLGMFEASNMQNLLLALLGRD